MPFSFDPPSPTNEPFTCPICNGTMTSDRPPVYIRDNCCCAQLGQLGATTNNLGSPAPTDAFARLSIGATPPYYTRPHSTPPSTTSSIEVEEGPSNSQDPNNHYLWLAPGPGDNQTTARRRASFDDQHSTSVIDGIRRYLNSLSPEERSSHGLVWANLPREEFLRLDTYMLGPGVIDVLGMSSSAFHAEWSVATGRGTPGVSSGSMSGSASGGVSSGILYGAGDWADVDPCYLSGVLSIGDDED